MMRDFVSLGNIVLDVYHDSALNTIGYYAGGSAFNNLINISTLSSDARCYCIASCGNDWAGDFVLEILASHGINVANVEKENRQTNRIHIILNAEKTKCQRQCPNCEKIIWYSNITIPKELSIQFKEMPKGVVIIDSLNKDVLELAKLFKKEGWFIAVDIGYVSYLRELGRNDIISFFSGYQFSLLQMNRRVYHFFLNKLDCKDEKGLFDFLKVKYLIITDGSAGAQFLYRTHFGNVVQINNKAVETQIVDPTGAGDAFLSKLLLSLDESGYFTEDINTVLNGAAFYAAFRVSTLGSTGNLKKC
jgi:sugar/nucleoside kinase (ribokinase family)